MNHLVRGATAALFAAVMFVASLSPALAADIEVIHSEETVQVAPADAWARVGGFCNLADFLSLVVTCEVIAGDGGMGSVRRLELGNGEVVEEPMVANGPIPAIVNAINDALDVCICEIPVTPEVVLRALDAKESGTAQSA